MSHRHSTQVPKGLSRLEKEAFWIWFLALTKPGPSRLILITAEMEVLSLSRFGEGAVGAVPGPQRGQSRSAIEGAEIERQAAALTLGGGM